MEKELERVRKDSMKVGGERPGMERRSMRKCVIMLSAVHRKVEQVFSFAVSMGLASDTAELGKQD